MWTLDIEGRHAVAQLVRVLSYKLEGRGFDSPWGHLSCRTLTLVSTQPLTEMNTRDASWT
jgi:hypothetical protein